MGQLRTCNKRHNRAIHRAEAVLHAAATLIVPVKTPAKAKPGKKAA
jgi:hypothetical protein